MSVDICSAEGFKISRFSSVAIERFSLKQPPFYWDNIFGTIHEYILYVTVISLSICNMYNN